MRRLLKNEYHPLLSALLLNVHALHSALFACEIIPGLIDR